MKLFLKFSGVTLLAALMRLPSQYLNSSIFYIFQERDVSRALELLKGKLIFFGPEVTGGGNLPGPFYYFLLSAPLSLGLGWFGIWNWMFLLLSVGGALGWLYFEKKFNSMAALLWLILYSLTSSTSQLIQMFLNPSFSIVFIILINILILKSFSEKNVNTRNRSFLLACVVTGLATQLHYSVIVYIFALVFLKIAAASMKLQIIEKKYFFLGLAGFALTLAPYFIWSTFRLFDLELGQEHWRSGVVDNALPSLFMHFRTALEMPATEFWVAGFRKLFLVIPIVFVILLFVRAVTGKPGVQTDQETESSSFIRILGLCLAVAFVPFSFYFFVPQGSRYGAPLAATFNFISLVMFCRYLVSAKAIKYFNFIASFFLVALCFHIFSVYNRGMEEDTLKVYSIIAVFLISAVYFSVTSHRQNRALVLSFVLSACLIIGQSLIQSRSRKSLHYTANLPQYWQWQRIISKIYNETGWTYDEFAERVYFINHHYEQAPRLAYELFAKENPRFAGKPTLAPDGYVVSVVEPFTSKNLDWILRQQLQDDIRSGLKSEAIVLGNFNSLEKILIAPYYVKNKQILPPFFSNLGLGYTHIPEETLLRSLDFVSGVKKIDNGNFIFKWNECPGHHYYCDTGVIVKVANTRPGLYQINLRIVGMSLSQGSKWISPDWTQNWVNPYVEIICDKKITRMPILSSVGHNQKYLTVESNFRYNLTNNSILAPLNRHFDFRCDGKLIELSVGRESSEIERITEFLTFPEARLTVKF